MSVSESNRSCSNQYRIQNAGGLDDLFGGLAGSLVVPHVKYFREMMLYSQWDVRCAHFMVNIRKAQTESAGDRNEPVFRLIGHNQPENSSTVNSSTALDTHLSRAVAILYICAMYACTLVALDALDVFRSRQDVRVSSCKIRGECWDVGEVMVTKSMMGTNMINAILLKPRVCIHIDVCVCVCVCVYSSVFA